MPPRTPGPSSSEPTPVRTATPANPMTVPATCAALGRARAQIAATITVKNGEVALRIAPSDAVRTSSAVAIVTNGIALLSVPSTTKSRQRCGSSGFRRRAAL